MEDMAKYKCEAGFFHETNEECFHMVPQFAPPDAMAKIVTDDFYSAEKTAERKKANQSNPKYQPMRIVTTRKIQSAVNAGDER